METIVMKQARRQIVTASNYQGKNPGRNRRVFSNMFMM